MRKHSLSVLTVLAIVLSLSLAVLLPSGAITEQARACYNDALSDDGFWDEDASLTPRAVLASAVFSDILPAANIQALPIDLFTPGSTPVEANFTEDGYRDDTIIVEMRQQRLYDSDVYSAYVKIATPSQLRTAVAGSKIGATSTNHTSKISENYNGIVAINGDYFTKTKAGYIVRMGETYREKTSKNMDLLLIDELGDFHLLLRGHDAQKDGVAAFLSQHTIVNGFFFGPALVKDGEKLEIPEGYQFDPNQKNPRAGIAQLDTLTYALVVVNGRTDQSAGVTMAEFADVMAQLGAKQDYNLDCGNSATLAFHGQVYNDKPQAERSVTDIIYFASAIDE